MCQLVFRHEKSCGNLFLTYRTHSFPDNSSQSCASHARLPFTGASSPCSTTTLSIPHSSLLGEGSIAVSMRCFEPTQEGSERGKRRGQNIRCEVNTAGKWALYGLGDENYSDVSEDALPAGKKK